jgi:small subunit ribosomal protein S6|tara:strand:+ start:1129 stop:1437 length:309 start_codon:yes stop_codon:yes gene_type:complete
MYKELEYYEAIYLISPNLTEQEVSTKMEFYQNFLQNKGSQVTVQNRGKRSLSYPIKGFETANFIQMLYVGNGNLLKVLTKEILRDARVLRHLITKMPSSFEI